MEPPRINGNCAGCVFLPTKTPNEKIRTKECTFLRMSSHHACCSPPHNFVDGQSVWFCTKCGLQRMKCTQKRPRPPTSRPPGKDDEEFSLKLPSIPSITPQEPTSFSRADSGVTPDFTEKLGSPTNRIQWLVKGCSRAPGRYTRLFVY